MRLALVPLLAALAVPAAALASEKKPAAAPKPGAGPSFSDQGVRFAFPAGFRAEEREEKEPNEPVETIFVGKRDAVEIRVEVEKGQLECTEKEVAGPPRPGKQADGSPTCEAETAAPPSLDPKIGPRRSATVLRQLPGRFLNVLVFAPTAEQAISLARQVSASGADEQA
jgi:hypothetical protein